MQHFGRCYSRCDARSNSLIGPGTVCVGSSIILTDTTAGGVWTSGNTSVATVGILTGVVTGASAGTAVITYTIAGGCYATTIVTVVAVHRKFRGLRLFVKGQPLR